MSPARRALLVAAALAAPLGLLGCPIPQPLPEYTKGTITPPRILTETATVNGSAFNGAVIRVPAGCPAASPPIYALGAQVMDATNLGAEVRWFVDYDASVDSTIAIRRDEQVQPSADASNVTHDLGAFTFDPYHWGTSYAAGEVHVVELVVSNSFSTDAAAALPNRTPAAGYETQVYRWVFQLVTGTAGAPLSCP